MGGGRKVGCHALRWAFVSWVVAEALSVVLSVIYLLTFRNVPIPHFVTRASSCFVIVSKIACSLCVSRCMKYLEPLQQELLPLIIACED
ncbi:MAG: hypothetical protein LBJ12_00525 [Oscillospiraceae bacterium]|nr:hypothetical protein [Oscillospiraceae bacterium]